MKLNLDEYTIKEVATTLEETDRRHFPRKDLWYA